MEFFWLLGQVMPDGGSYYAETNPDYWLREPWNAFSSLSFWLPVFYWGNKIKGQYRQYLILSISLPLLFMGGLGSALFHAFRNSSWLLFMDVLPILALTSLLSFYLWQKLIRWPLALGLFLVYFSIQSYLWNFSQIRHIINLVYLLRGLMMFLPAFIIILRLPLRFTYLISGAALCFALALFFRFWDQSFTLVFPMGSHWLWHLSTALGGQLIGHFLYELHNYERAAMEK